MRVGNKFGIVLLCAILIGTAYSLFFTGTPAPTRQLLSRSYVGSLLSEPLTRGELPTEVELITPNPDGSSGVKRAELEYTLNQDAQTYITDLITRYKPDFASFVALDAQTGRIISLVSYHKDPADAAYGNLAYRAIFPAASIFKVVTATAAIDLNKLNPDTMIAFNGASHTLYKRNVTETKYNRWTRFMSLKEAFGKSVNTVFGKVGAFHVGPKSLLEYATRFNFDKKIDSEVPVETGFAFKPESGDAFEIAEAASGFNKESRMSPLQGALIASAVVNDGVMMQPYLVEQISGSADGEVLYQHQDAPAAVTMKPSSAQQIRELMNETVEAGTSRKSFRLVFGRKLDTGDIQLGGKTGSLTANEPKGKVDWFVGYARSPNERIAVAALTLHKKYWTVKSSYLGASYLEYYFKTRLAERRKRDKQLAVQLRQPASIPAHRKHRK